MSKFRPGDKVRCIDPRDRLVLNKHYTVKRSRIQRCTPFDSEEFITIDGFHIEYYARRFELVKEDKMRKFNVGDKVMCIRRDTLRELMTNGIYIVSRVFSDIDGEELLDVQDSSGTFFRQWLANRFVHVDSVNEEKQMNEFKVGDSVISNDSFGDLVKNKIYTVNAVRKSRDGETYIDVKDCYGKHLIGFYSSRFTLVSTVRKDTPEQLLEVFLKGIEAKNKLVELGVLELKASEIFKWALATKSTAQYRLKPKKEFKSFQLQDSGYIVNYEREGENVISVGCKNFSFNELILDLRYILEENKPSTELLVCTAKGVYHENNLVSYKDAHQLFNAMKEYVSE